ncbi:hypothetical protein GVN16_24210 [Emticicia sp. CRIBPO]|uniref:hypothetical protein n=1 Tax=Emticicia sp. CRIBPO TaxID=2683258 RepID=UPI0014120CD0|nr:hypothetical protein [Emticicia sp. CRIBPO]NBA88901.1 hypothetical protein [Emticicia sp. CRIBPO]
MANEPNSGHVKNVSSFESLVTFCADYGSAYQPSKKSLSFDNLRSVLESATSCMNDCKAKEIAYDNAVDGRIEAFKSLKGLSTKVVNALKVSEGISNQINEAARTINHRVQGTRPTSETKVVSSSKQGFDERIAEFAGLVELVKSQPTYQPNEPHLKTEGLEAHLAMLKASHGAINQAYTEWESCRARRDGILYAPGTGMVPVALDVKDYLKTAFGTDTSQYLRVKKLKFRNAD